MEVARTCASPTLERRYLAALSLEESNLEKRSRKDLRAFSEKFVVGGFEGEGGKMGGDSGGAGNLLGGGWR